MGELGEYWREHRDHLRSKASREGTTYYAQGLGRKRSATIVRFSKKFEKLGFRKCSDWHWQAKVDGDLLDYWPSKAKWRYRGVTYTRKDAEMVALLKQKGAA